ncbi:MAG TPA: hypothetical protein VG408_06050 [Actinomycetota bacterium]|nr:hypothetical protein [Actinomycetota bacterium]
MRKLSLALACLAVLVTATTAHARVVEKSDNVKQVADLKLGRVTELAIQDGRAYALGPETISAIDLKTRKVLGTFECVGGFGGSEIETMGNGLLAFNAGGGCGLQGVALLDFSNVKDPRLISASPAVNSHTLTAYPGEPFVYVSPNGAIGDGTRRGTEQIVDFRNPKKPEVTSFVSNGLGCHDVGFFIKKDKKLAACAAGAETQIWDVSDPLAPVIISRTPTPQVFFNHSATFSPDGNLLVVGDEAHGVTSCAGVPTGAIWFYDVSNPVTPVLVGYHGVARGSTVSSFWATPDTWCSAHMYNFKPGTRLLVTAWYEGGINVLDLEDPTTPQEVGFYRASGDFSPWAAYWAGNNIWTSDEHAENGGVEVFSIKP